MNSPRFQICHHLVTGDPGTGGLGLIRRGFRCLEVWVRVRLLRSSNIHPLATTPQLRIDQSTCALCMRERLPPTHPVRDVGGLSDIVNTLNDDYCLLFASQSVVVSKHLFFPCWIEMFRYQSITGCCPPPAEWRQYVRFEGVAYVRTTIVRFRSFFVYILYGFLYTEDANINWGQVLVCCMQLS